MNPQLGAQTKPNAAIERPAPLPHFLYLKLQDRVWRLPTFQMERAIPAPAVYSISNEQELPDEIYVSKYRTSAIYQEDLNSILTSIGKYAELLDQQLQEPRKALKKLLDQHKDCTEMHAIARDGKIVKGTCLAAIETELGL